MDDRTYYRCFRCGFSYATEDARDRCDEHHRGVDHRAENKRLRKGIESLMRQYRRSLPSVAQDLRDLLATGKQEGPDDA